jgi:hypothetical protein
MAMDLAIPDYTSLCKRAKQRDIAIAIRKTQGKIDVIVDSTGLKVYSEGECSHSHPGFEPLLAPRIMAKASVGRGASCTCGSTRTCRKSWRMC